MAYAQFNMDGAEWLFAYYYSAVKSEKTIFMKCKGDKYVIHGLSIDSMMHIYTCNAMKEVFLALYKKEFRQHVSACQYGKYKIENSWIW